MNTLKKIFYSDVFTIVLVVVLVAALVAQFFWHQEHGSSTHSSDHHEVEML